MVSSGHEKPLELSVSKFKVQGGTGDPAAAAYANAACCRCRSYSLPSSITTNLIYSSRHNNCCVRSYVIFLLVRKRFLFSFRKTKICQISARCNKAKNCGNASIKLFYYQFSVRYNISVFIWVFRVEAAEAELRAPVERALRTAGLPNMISIQFYLICASMEIGQR
jgi:hypothetical protein